MLDSMTLTWDSGCKMVILKHFQMEVICMLKCEPCSHHQVERSGLPPATW